MFDEALRIVISKSWNSETCVPSLREKWSEENPSLGQCAITALVVNDFLGGNIMRCMSSTGSHYYNFIDNEIMDFTREQFGQETPDYEHGEERSREYLLGNEDTKARYTRLVNNVRENISINKKRCLEKDKEW